ncbi:molybdopterin-dependent oxidoreductase [Hymenobacter humi]|uniref:Molybdopterin-dependent oxidoreductase n=1 Tax=Hymenobacter humi TaxID=1411620 RepID=A0ABW2UCA5_9BACT
MIPHFSEAERAVHYPDDRRAFVAVKPYVLLVAGGLALTLVGAAWGQYLLGGLPDVSGLTAASAPAGPAGFPWWVNLSHWANFFFLTLLIRSGLSILFDHPRLYWNNGCTPTTEWARFTPVVVPMDRVWTAKEDNRYLSPVLGLPGYRHTIGIARVWHLLTVPLFLLNGAGFVLLLLFTGHWHRLVPGSWQVLPEAWKVFVYYATLHLPPEPNGFYHYNALQQLSYFAVVFLLAPLAMLTGLAMSPAIENRFHWYPKLFGNRQSARSLHFLVLVAYVVFLVIHVGMVAATGLVRNMNHIVLGTDDASSRTGLYLGLVIVLVTIAFGGLAHWLSWRKQRGLQALQAAVNGTLWRATLNHFTPSASYQKKDISPYFWANGKIPVSAEWQALAANNFADYKLKIGGLVETPVELSLAELQALAKEQHITMHHCIQGWSGVAEWGGVPLQQLVDLVKPHANARTVVFYSFGEGPYGGQYYDTHTLENCQRPQSILAWEMNYAPLPVTYGAPLRLRVENQWATRW